jgi:membrane-bound inhibitor of C-type lysozyme
MTFRKFVFYIVIVVLIVIIALTFIHKSPVTPPVVTNPVATTTTPTAPVVLSSGSYACDDNKTITASFSSNSASLVLSDGRTLTLPQIVSADGAQYQSGAIEFITKGDQGFLQENGNTTYADCIEGETNTVTNGMKAFSDATVSFNYPQTFILSGGGIGYSENWKSNTDGTLGLNLVTVKAPTDYQPKTNLGDATFTVGTSSDPKAVASCLMDNSGLGAAKTTVTYNGITYTKLVTTDAGAGNRYETTSYRTVQNSQCYAIEYTLHYSELANYDPSMGITAFNSTKVHADFDGIVASLKFLPQ